GPDSKANTGVNEAVTENIAKKLANYFSDAPEAYDGSDRYIHARRNLNSLLAAGLKEDALLLAYFENFSADQPRVELGRHFKELLQEFERVDGKGAWQRLEHANIMGYIDNDFTMYLLLAEKRLEKLHPSLIPEDGQLWYVDVRVGRSDQTAVLGSFTYL